MSLLNTLERKFQRYAISNITIYIIAGQTIFWALFLSKTLSIDKIALIPSMLFAGEWWRLITFIFIPPIENPVFAFFAWYLFYLIGDGLEGYWGAFRYNLFLLVSYLITVMVALFFVHFTATNIFMGGSLFLAFAYLYPDFQLYIFFIIPIRIKWLATLMWITYAVVIIAGTWHIRLLALASISNFLLFFGQDIAWKIKNGNRRMLEQILHFSGKQKAFHKCTICGKTDVSHPQMEFRYCQECDGACYCMAHINNHKHIK